MSAQFEVTGMNLLDSKQIENAGNFESRHLGPRANDIKEMLDFLGVSSLEQLVDKTVPESIRIKNPLKLDPPISEQELLALAQSISSENLVAKSLIGLGFSDTVTPPVIARNILENPCWYTQYTPYQAEIAQGRLEALINFQTMVSDLCGMSLANASLLDEGSAAAEAMSLAHRVCKRSNCNSFFVSNGVHPPTIEVIKTRAQPLGIDVVVGSEEEFSFDESCFAVLLQYPSTNGAVKNHSDFAKKCRDNNILLAVCTDLLALCVLEAPGEWGADIAVGNSQRFGVPLGYGGPHAAFIATSEQYKREIPGRIVGVSKDTQGRSAYRLALQTREQHIRRERATSNICTAQVLLAIMAGMYAVYHGPDGLRRIANKVHELALSFADSLLKLGFSLGAEHFFDTVQLVLSKEEAKELIKKALKKNYNLRDYGDGKIGFSFDETNSLDDVSDLLEIVSTFAQKSNPSTKVQGIPKELQRISKYLQHPIFSLYHSETELLRYITRLQNKDLSLAVSMIPLGSCTMKLNASAEMIPVSYQGFSRIHPFAPSEQTRGYQKLIEELESMLAEITGLPAVSLQPNAGSQGEYAGLMAIRKYLYEKGEHKRKTCIIPQSAHGTNPASAILAGMQVLVVGCDENGNIDVDDLRKKAVESKDNLAALMVTYPSTHGVFEESICDICDIIHENGGQVYMDGANLNAQVGLCRPGEFGVDVCHLNLHKTFCIPHGGGGPGIGPIATAQHLAPFLPGKALSSGGFSGKCGPVCSGPFGSASILPISWAYIKLMGAKGLTKATQVAILNANYIAKRLEGHFDVLYRGANGLVAHECILDLRQFKRKCGIEVADVAKRLMDYGFHAPTVSWPVVETLMVEPTESESREELDRFCDALISIRSEISEVEEGLVSAESSVLRNAPHSVEKVCSDDWSFNYSREKAAFPLTWIRERKFWPACSRIDNSYGDRNLFCSCIPLEN